MLQIYGSPRSSARRCYWALEELELPYQRIPLDMAQKEHKSAAFLKLNPNGKVPCLVDGNLSLWESMAINHYLCEKHGRQLLGKSPEEGGLIQQWSFWALAELQKPLVDILIQKFFVPDERRDQKVIERASAVARPLLALLDQFLTAKTFLVGNRFTLADLNVASVVHICSAVQYDISEFRNLSAWMHDCASRPAFRKVLELPA